MPAQIGSNVVLSYGPQGSRQVGSAVLLDAIVVATSTRVSSGLRARWGGSEANARTVQAKMDASLSIERATDVPWAAGRALDDAERHPWSIAAAGDARAAAPWARFTKSAQSASVAPWAVSRATDDAAQAPWGRYGARAQPESVSAWVISRATDDASMVPWGGFMSHVERDAVARFPASAGRDLLRYVPWVRFSRTMQPGWGVQIPEWDGVPDARVVIPVRRVYMTVNNAYLRRVDGNIMLDASSMGMSLDVNSWVWSFRATIPGSQLSAVSPVNGEPVEVEAYVNGAMFRFLVEGIQRERQFGRSDLAITGRGKAALLDSKYAPVQSFGNAADRTLQQIMGDVLTVNGIPMGWTVNFGMTDWLVPAGVWAHTGSYISALNQLAAAGGAYIQPHAVNNELSVLLRYPVAPWEWGTLIDPDFDLPSALVTRESMEWADKPRYNRVYVSGQQQGVLGRVTRAGTAGDLLAQPIVDPLITHADAARQRGIAVLSDTGRVNNVGLRMPVLSDTSVIVPGKFVRYQDGGAPRTGIVRAVSVDVSPVEVWQTINVETHE